MVTGADVEFLNLGDSAIIARFGDAINEAVFQRVQGLTSRLAEAEIPGLREVVPAYASVTVYYDPSQRNHGDMVSVLTQFLNEDHTATDVTGTCVTIPVLYGGEHGPDLNAVAEHCGLSPCEVVEIHTSACYRVYMIGFAPGFPYLGGMSQRIATPRRSTPRVAIPEGSVGIAGAQTGVYPLSTPGGWQLIGRTPMPLFRPHSDPPTRLQAGDTVRFESISEREYRAYKEAKRERY